MIVKSEVQFMKSPQYFSEHCVFSFQQAKSEEQLATERAWLEAERLWLIHRAGFSAARRLPEEFSGSGGGDSDTSKLRIRLEATEEVLQVDDDDVEKV
jgi:myosin-18